MLWSSSFCLGPFGLATIAKYLNWIESHSSGNWKDQDQSQFSVSESLLHPFLLQGEGSLFSPIPTSPLNPFLRFWPTQPNHSLKVPLLRWPHLEDNSFRMRILGRHKHSEHSGFQVSSAEQLPNLVRFLN